MTPLFLYGSLREGSFNYDIYLKELNLTKKVAKINGYHLFHIKNKGYPACIKGDGTVYGELYYVDKETLDKLQNLEQYFEYNKENSEYIYTLTTIELEDGSKTEAYMYLYNLGAYLNENDELIYIKSGDWISS